MFAVTACTGTKVTPDKTGTEKVEDTETSMTSVKGQWMIENVVENDSSYVRPADIEPGMTAYIDFREDNTFGITTNCNHLGGNYTQSNDSLHLTDILTTEMACDNMEVEEMLKKILPMVNAIDCINDSVARLNTGKGDSYIVLKKTDIALK